MKNTFIVCTNWKFRITFRNLKIVEKLWKFCTGLDVHITYIIGHYNPSVRIIDLVSYTTYVVCVNFIHKWRDAQSIVYSEQQIFWETFHGSFNLLSELMSEICWEEIAKEILFLYRFDVWPWHMYRHIHTLYMLKTYLFIFYLSRYYECRVTYVVIVNEDLFSIMFSN